ncbi:MAG: prephenate dehydratase [Terriglobales bacterium]
MRVAIQGEAGSFSHEAALRMIPGCTIAACARSAEVFERVIRGSVAAAVIPIENTLAGSVAEHYDLLLTSKVFIQREFRLRIVHNLIAGPKVKKSALRRVLSHPVALDQCRNLFRRHPAIEAVPFYDTAGSVKHIMENQLKDAAGIASRRAAVIYKAHILAAGIEDDRHNFTRFVLVRKARRVLDGANKTSIAFTLRNVAGALHGALAVFAKRKISLSKVESRPLRGRPWEYVFYCDFLRGDDKVARDALQHLAKFADSVKVLGIYPSV